MNKRELLEMLEYYEDDTEIYFSYNYGDYGNTLVASSIDNADEQYIKYSNYHRMFKVVEDSDDMNIEDDKVKKVIVLS